MLQYIVKRLQFESMNVQVRIIPLSVLLILAIVFASLGQWQLKRKIEKQDLIARFEQAREMSLQHALDSGLDFARAEVWGQYESNWQLLLDNKIWQGKTGVHVLSLFYSDEGIPLLVDRGWLAMSPDRRSLPDVVTPDKKVVITGLLSRPHVGGVRLGQPDSIGALEGSLLLTYLDIDQVAKAAGLAIAPLILKLDAADSSGFENREWRAAVILPNQHQAYAVQWFALSMAAIILIFSFGIRLHRTRR